jgi:hypothetical protein
MNRVAVLKDVAYGAKVGGGTIAGMAEVDLLVNGSMAVFNINGELLVAAGTNAAAVFGDKKEAYIAFGRNETPLIVNVPRQVNYINLVNKRNAVAPIITIGGTTAALGLPLENEGDAVIKVFESTHSDRFGIPSIRASVYKKANMTTDQMFAKLVATLNASTQFGGVTATLIGASPNYGITITPKNPKVSISVALSGMFEGGSIVNTTPAVYPFGDGQAIAQMEYESSVEEGNQGFIERAEAWFKGTLQTDVTAQYNVVTIGYGADHQGPTTKRNVMDKTLSIASVDGAATLDADNVLAILAFVFPNYASATVGQELANDDGTENDGIAGN